MHVAVFNQSRQAVTVYDAEGSVLARDLPASSIEAARAVLGREGWSVIDTAAITQVPGETVFTLSR